VAYNTVLRVITELEACHALTKVGESKRDRVFCARAILVTFEEPARLVPDPLCYKARGHPRLMDAEPPPGRQRVGEDSRIMAGGRALARHLGRVGGHLGWRNFQDLKPRPWSTKETHKDAVRKYRVSTVDACRRADEYFG
jgi:hypothetical protein